MIEKPHLRVPGYSDPAPTLNTIPVELRLTDSKGATRRLAVATTAKDVHTPYLGLRARLSQVWINRWTILLLLILLRVMLLLTSLDDNLGDAKLKALSACTKVEDVGSAMASMPHYLSVGVNRLTAKGVTEAVQAMIKVLSMIITAVEQVISFVIHMLTDTYVCLISMAVHAGLNVTAAVVEEATKIMNGAIDGLADNIGKVVQGVESVVDNVWGDIRDIASNLPFGAGDPIVQAIGDAPNMDISDDLNKMKSIDISSVGIVERIEQLERDLPTFDEVRNITNHAISIPFDLVRSELNKTYGAWKFSPDVFPVAQKEALSFCSDNSGIQDFFETLFKLMHSAKIAFIVVLCILAVLACVPMAYLEIRRWRKHQENIKRHEGDIFDARDLGSLIQRPTTTKLGIVLSHKLVRDGRTERGRQRRYLVRWCIEYGTSLPALFVLCLALAGFFSCLCQYMILNAIEKEVPGLANQVGDFAAEVVTKLEEVSTGWATDANGVMLGVQDDINNDVLGYVTNATDAVNDTITVFTDKMDEGLTLAFGGTILEAPIKDVIRCLVGLKIESVQKGLTWVHDNARVSLPLFDNDTFSAGARDSVDGDSDLHSFLATPASVTTDEVTGAVTHVTDLIRAGLREEALISSGLLLLYLFILLSGIVYALANMATAGHKSRGEGGAGAFGTASPTQTPSSPRLQAGFRSRSVDSVASRARAVQQFPVAGYDDSEKTGRVAMRQTPPVYESPRRQSVHGQYQDSRH